MHLEAQQLEEACDDLIDADQQLEEVGLWLHMFPHTSSIYIYIHIKIVWATKCNYNFYLHINNPPNHHIE